MTPNFLIFLALSRLDRYGQNLLHERVPNGIPLFINSRLKHWSWKTLFLDMEMYIIYEFARQHVFYLLDIYERLSGLFSFMKLTYWHISAACGCGPRGRLLVLFVVLVMPIYFRMLLTLGMIWTAFVLRHPLVASAVFGATKLWQLEEVLDGCRVELIPEIVAEIDRVHSAFPNPCPW